MSYKKNTANVTGENPPDVTSDTSAKLRFEKAVETLDKAKKAVETLAEAKKAFHKAILVEKDAKENLRRVDYGIDLGEELYVDAASAKKRPQVRDAYKKASENLSKCRKEFNETQSRQGGHDLEKELEKAEKEFYAAEYAAECVADTPFWTAFNKVSGETAKRVLKYIRNIDEGMNRYAKRMFAAVKVIRVERSVNFETISGEDLLDHVLDVMTAQHRRKMQLAHELEDMIIERYQACRVCIDDQRTIEVTEKFSSVQTLRV